LTPTSGRTCRRDSDDQRTPRTGRASACGGGGVTRRRQAAAGAGVSEAVSWPAPGHPPRTVEALFLTVHTTSAKPRGRDRSCPGRRGVRLCSWPGSDNRDRAACAMSSPARPSPSCQQTPPSLILIFTSSPIISLSLVARPPARPPRSFHSRLSRYLSARSAVELPHLAPHARRLGSPRHHHAALAAPSGPAASRDAALESSPRSRQPWIEGTTRVAVTTAAAPGLASDRSSR